MGMHNGRNRIANGKRLGLAPRTKPLRKHRKSPAGQADSTAQAGRSTAPLHAAKPTGVIRAPLRSFPSDVVIPVRHDGATMSAQSPDRNCSGVLARRESLQAETKRFGPRPALAARSLARQPDAIKPGFDDPGQLPKALPLPTEPEPLVTATALPLGAALEASRPLPRNRALVAPPTGLVGKLVTWLSGSTRRLWHGAPSTTRPRKGTRPDELALVLLRADLRELRAELAIARRIAERHALRATTLVREGAR